MAEIALNRKFLLNIITPRGYLRINKRTIAFENLPVDMIIFRTLDGDMGVLTGHEPHSALLGYNHIYGAEAEPHSNSKDDAEISRDINSLIHSTTADDFKELRIFTDGAEREDLKLMIYGGFFSIKDDVAVISTEMAERPHNLQDVLVKYETERKANPFREQTENSIMLRTEKAIRRALVRLDASTYSIIQGHWDRNDE